MQIFKSEILYEPPYINNYIFGTKIYSNIMANFFSNTILIYYKIYV